jgi:hypothetical protein
MRLGRDVLELDLYAILGVTPEAGVEAIRTAYRRRALRSHPDLNRDNLGGAQREMVDLNVAAWVLTDPELRRQYDSGRPKNRAARSRAWYERVCYGDTDWVVPPRRPPERARTAELAELLRRIRLWPSRAMLEIAEWTDGLSIKQRTTLTAACVVTAVLLISYAKPRSLTRLFERDAARTTIAAEPSSEGW